MSADNWATCPKCYAKAIDAKKNVDSVYGKVSKEEYSKLLIKANDMLGHIANTSTLREDYEIGIIKGKFYISYCGECEVCNFSFNYAIEEKLEVF